MLGRYIPLSRTPVPVPVPDPASGADGETVDRVCIILFRYLPAKESAELAAQGDEAFLLAAVAGWDEIEGPDGQPLEFSRDPRRAAENIERHARGPSRRRRRKRSRKSMPR